MPRLLVLFFFVSFLSKGILAQDIKFSLPLKGVEGKDYFINCYVDHDPTSGIQDAYCGTKTYDGHRGTDFMLRSFKTMDSGVYVYAAADGIVFSIRDGNFDRNKVWIEANHTKSNYVGINHGGKYYTYYHHLMKYSLVVKVGDTVKRGQAIGKVGSSGFSSGPHVHFEVWDSTGKVVDPFSGKCQTKTQGLWMSEPLYDTTLYVIDDGFVPYVPNLDTLRERFM